MLKATRNIVPKDKFRQASLAIFKKVLEVCNKLDIDVWVTYGTLIGAVRHHGFIPWDDDFDITMKRKDYDKFISCCVKDKSLLSPYYIDHYTCDLKYPFYIARICDPNYQLVFDNMDYTSGLFIDLYPLDGMGNNLDFWRLNRQSNSYKLKIKLIQKAILGRNWKDPFRRPFSEGNIIKKMLRGIWGVCAKSGSNRFWMRKLDRIALTYSWDKSKYVGCVCWNTKVYGIKRVWYEGTVWLSFEDLKVPVPKGYHEVLNEIYGNYMKLPPKEKRVATHWYKAYYNN